MAVSPLVIKLHCSHAFCVQSGAPKNSGRSSAPQSWDRLMFGNDDKFPARFCSFSDSMHLESIAILHKP
ncbi:hypothetical protein EJ110_NYTH12693 [Nymphaea thermarum]|nr:hypothetical protein EJ110_NYTH12693 [Nymphaea thermarum]